MLAEGPGEVNAGLRGAGRIIELDPRALDNSQSNTV